MRGTFDLTKYPRCTWDRSTANHPATISDHIQATTIWAMSVLASALSRRFYGDIRRLPEPAAIVATAGESIALEDLTAVWTNFDPLSQALITAVIVLQSVTSAARRSRPVGTRTRRRS